MAFKHNHLADVQMLAARNNFTVEENVFARTCDVPELGSYGDRDAILWQAARQLDVVYPPIFFVSESGTVTSVHGHDWEAALAAVEDEMEP